MSSMVQSAARSKERKEQYTVMLEGQVASLQAELASERAQMKQLQDDMKILGMKISMRHAAMFSAMLHFGACPHVKDLASFGTGAWSSMQLL